MSASNTSGSQDRAAFERRLGELRPKLHRYCARMTGSVIDGEDVVQDALLKATKGFDDGRTPHANLSSATNDTAWPGLSPAIQSPMLSRSPSCPT
jgi:DNA-directed RNA polymerase specialized sigma24 family protein